MDRDVSGFDHTAPSPFSGMTFTNDSFDDLDLFLYKADTQGNPIGDAVAAPISGWAISNPDDPGAGWDSVEHLHLTVDDPGRYLLRVQ